MRMIRIVPGLAVPDYMGFLLEYCEPVKHTREAIEAGHLLRIDYHPPYLQLRCRDIGRVIDEAWKKKLRVYWAKHHITVTDGIYRARIYLDEKGVKHHGK